MNDTEVRNLEQSLRRQYESDLAAIRRVRELLSERQGLNGTAYRSESEPEGEEAAQQPLYHPELAIESNGTVESKVLSVIQKFDDKFTLADVVDKLQETYPNIKFNRNTISGIVFRNKDKAFRVVTPGRGRKLAYYENMI